jgi:poly-gamma-glutamate capsule biosynthesis protein CapA/YwtB (metallophosphatase superfamily)
LILSIAEACAIQPSAPGPDLVEYPWLYLRDGEALEAAEDTIELIAVGDVMLGRGVSGEPDPFGAAASWLRGADLAIGNLECAMAPEESSPEPATPAARDNSPQQPYHLVAPPEAAGLLREAGFDLLGLANNHALDRGLAGLADTARLLEDAGLAPIGAGPDLASAYRPVVRAVGDQRLAFLAFNAVPSPRGPQWTGELPQAEQVVPWTLAGWERQQALAAVRSARQEADAVIVSIHWGYEYETRLDPLQRAMAAALVEAGADLVLGHHPHVVQAVESMHRPDGGEAVIAYSLGNFVFDQGFEHTGQGLALRIFFDRAGLRAVQGLPVLAGLRPALVPPGQAGPLFEPQPASAAAPQPAGGSPSAKTIVFQCDVETCAEIELAALAQEAGRFQGGRFTQGETDLTGDGLVERVSLEAGRVRIESTAGGSDWISPPEWQVLDLAAGDPNHDGRQELMLALRKPDRAGVLLSHPFVLGYRSGEYKILWGGSAASDPIVEVELGDLDGDGFQELAVLEELHAGQGMAVSVWRWNGWGFSQFWRSSPARYSGLQLIPLDETTSGRVVLTSKDD